MPLIEPAPLRHGSSFMDRTGQTFGKLFVTGCAGRCHKTKRYFWNVRCECGREKIVFGDAMVRGLTKTCGHCGDRPHGTLTHGLSKTRTYRIWANIKNRCFNPNVPEYKFYGGRGITIIPEWRKSFESFVRDVGICPSTKHQLDRINNDGNYEPDNVRWTDKLTQANNTRSNRFINHAGKTLTLSQWARESGIAATTISTRLRRGWSMHSAITVPSQIYHKEPSSYNAIKASTCNN